MLANIQSVVGEGAAQALLRYAGFTEGQRIAREEGQGRLDVALQALDHLLGHTSTGMTQADGSVEIQIHQSVLVDEDRNTLDSLLVGLYEGLLQAVLETRYQGRVVGRPTHGRCILRFEPGRVND